MAESTIVKTKCDGTILFEDGAGTPVSYTVAYEAGDLTINLPGKTVNAFLDRGKFGSTPSLRYGDEQAITFSFTAHLRDLSDGTDVVLPDFLLDTDGDLSTAAGSAQSTLGTNAEVMTWTVTFTIEGTDRGDASDHVIELSFCHVTGSISEGDPDTISIEGTSYQQYPTALT